MIHLPFDPPTDPNDRGNAAPEPDERFSRSVLLDPRKVEKSRNRWRQLIAAAHRIRPEAWTGRVLDVGFGAGHFLCEGLRLGMDVWGVDRRETKARRFHRLVDFLKVPVAWKHRALVGEGQDLFPTARA